MAKTTTKTTCDVCGVTGEAGDQPGEGRIVNCGGESFGGRVPAHGKVCDDCADGARAAQASPGTLLTVAQVEAKLAALGTSPKAFWSIAGGGDAVPVLAGDVEWIADAADRSVS